MLERGVVRGGLEWKVLATKVPEAAWSLMRGRGCDWAWWRERRCRREGRQLSTGEAGC